MVDRLKSEDACRHEQARTCKQGLAMQSHHDNVVLAGIDMQLMLRNIMQQESPGSMIAELSLH